MSPLILYGCDTSTYDTKARTEIEDIRQKSAEGNAWAGRSEVRGTSKIFTMRTVTVCAPSLPVHAAKGAVRAPRARLDILVEKKISRPTRKSTDSSVNKYINKKMRK